MQTIVYQCDTAMPAQKLPNCCNGISHSTPGKIICLFQALRPACLLAC